MKEFPIEYGKLTLNEDGSYTEFDENGTPLGTWYPNDDDTWTFQDLTPLGDTAAILPQTGVLKWPVPVLAGSGLVLVLCGYISIRKRSQAESEAERNHENE